MRILLTSVYAWPEVVRGGERYVHELAAALVRAGHRVRIVATASRPGHDRVLGVPVTRWRARALVPRRFEGQAVEVGFGVQALRLLAARADVWHATSTGDAASAALAGKLRPHLATVFTDHGFPAARSREARRDARLFRQVVKHIGAYVCVSEAAAACLRADYHRDPVVVPPGVALERYRPAAQRAPRPTLLYAGSLVEPRKNVALLLRAAVRLAARMPDLDVWLCGPGAVAPLLETVPGAAALVSVARPVHDVELAERYAQAWVTVLPSHAESFGMVVVESFASGTPAVVLAHGRGPAGLVREGVTGVLAADTTEGLTAACASALELARAPATAQACRDAAAPYDWDRCVVPRLEAVYAGAA